MTYLTRKFLPRRTFLRSAGIALSLPLLDAMIPAHTALAKTAAAAKLRMGFVYFPHGAIMDKWTPTTEGENYELSPILEPLKPFRQQLTVVSGLGNRPAQSAAVHAIVPGTWLSCVHPRETHEAYGGITVDQMAAMHIGQETPLPSLEVATEAPGGGGACDRSYGCSYSGTVSFRTPTTPLPMEYNPRSLFQRLFGRGNTAAERKLQAQQYASILDMVVSEANDLRRSLGGPDRAALDDYLESIREIERRVQKAEKQDLSKLALPDMPVGIPDAFPDQMGLMFDMMALAWQADLTRIQTFMMAAEVSNMTYNHIGIADAFHPLSHHQNDATKKDKLVRIQRWHTEQFARFLKKLAEMPDGEGSLLDHSMIVYGSNMSNSDAHNQFPLPTSIVGGGAGRMKSGRHVRYPDHTPLSNVLLTLLDKAGVPQTVVGDSTGLLSEI
ncbi:MAG: DUF1552 domain-containing protein [Proteobacteria bacterium]|nr:DUF1552 domain-containing protein [Pseudomonadota bacterium]